MSKLNSCLMVILICITGCGKDNTVISFEERAPAIFTPGLSIRSEHGQLQLSWTAYKGSDFVAYRLYDKRDGKNEVRFTSTDASQTSWIDSTFIGGQTTYELSVITEASADFRIEQSFSAPAAAITRTDITRDRRALIHWNPGDFGANVVSYKVLRRADEDYWGTWTEIPLTEVLTQADTAFFDLSVVFGRAYEYRIISYSSTGDTVSSSPVSFFVGHKLPFALDTVFYVASLNCYYFYAYPTKDIYRVDAETFKILATRVGSNSDFEKFDVSPDGKVLIVTGDFEFLSLDPLDLQLLKTYPTTPLTGYKTSPGHIAVLDDGRIFFSSYTRTGSGGYSVDGFVYADLEAGKMLGKGPAESLFTWLDVIGSGPYFLVGGGYLDLKKMVADYMAHVKSDFIPEEYYAVLDENHVIDTSDRKIAVIELSSRQVTRQYSLDFSLYKPTNDPSTGYLGGYDVSGGWYRVFDVSTGRQIDQVEVVNNQSYWMANGVLFGSKGYYLPL